MIPAGSVPIYLPLGATVTSSPTVGLTSVLISPTNYSRINFILYNNSSNSAYVTYGSTSMSSACSIIIPTFSQYVHNSIYSYCGPLSAIRNAGSGAIIVTELYHP